MATIEEHKLKITILGTGSFYKTEPNTPHNVFLAAQSIIHTIKLCTPGDIDWIPAPTLDDATLHLTEDDLKFGI